MSQKITILGEALIDFIATESGNLTTVKQFEKKIGGAPLNVAYILSQMSKTPIFLGAVGEDSFGESIIKNISSYIDTKNIKRSQLPTTLAFVSLDKDGERSFEFFRGADQDYQYQDIPQAAFQSKIFHFCSATAFLEGNLYQTYLELLEYAKNNQKFISFDPNYRDALFSKKKDFFIEKSKIFLKHSHLVKLSEEELFLITKTDKLQKAKKTITQLSKENSYIVITMGEKGSILIKNEKEETVKTKPVKMVDSTGAGDAFIGSLLSQILEVENFEFQNMIYFMKISSIIAASVTLQKGAQIQIPSLEEIKKELNLQNI